MTAPASEQVRVLDLTKPGLADAYLDALDSGTAGLAALPRRVVVVDRVSTLLDHHRRYARLAALAQVDKVVCIAVGGLAGEQPRLRQSTAMVTVAATLWVGDEQGVSWAGGADRASPTGWDTGDGLQDLVTALRTVEVFDEVYRRTREFRYQTASPGLDVEGIDVAERVLAQRRVVALRGITATGMAAREQESVSRLSEFLDRAGESASGTRRRGPGTMPVDGECQQARVHTQAQLERAAEAMRRLAGLAGLLGAGGGVRHTVRWLLAAGNALGAYLALVTETVRLVGAHLVTGQPPVHELVHRGLPQPSGVDRVALTADVEAAVSAELRAGHPLPEISAQLRRFAVRTAPQGAVGAKRALSSSGVETLAARLTTPPPVTLGRPVALTLLGGMAFGTCLSAGVLPGAGGVAGPLVSLGWMLMTALLLIRCSTRAGTAAAWEWPLVVVGLSAAVGVVGGRLLRPASALPWEAELVLIVLSVVVLLATGMASWTLVIRGWARRVGVADAFGGYQRVNGLLDEMISAIWRPAQHHRCLADTTQAVASVIDEVAKAATETLTILEESSTQRTRAVDDDPGGQPELIHVLRQDLAELAILSITPCLGEIRRGGQVSMTTGQHLGQVRRLLTGYSAHLETHGVHVLPPGITDDAPRQRLRMAMWQQSSAARRILANDQYSPLVQLCAAGDVHLLHVADAEAFRFAPEQAREFFGADDVTWTSGNAVGVLRLVPLRSGLVDVRPVRPEEQSSDEVRH